MGLSCSWIAVQGAEKSAVLDRLGFTESDELAGESVPDQGYYETPEGWLIIFVHDLDWASPEKIAALSSGALAIGCQMSEHVMCSDIRAYRDGACLWSVNHDPEKDLNGIEVGGAAPPELGAIRENAERQQETEGDDVDFIFDIPIALSATICGFRPDEDGPASLERFRLLQGGRAEKKRGWLSRLFGGSN